MLQQTASRNVLPVFREFVDRYPTIKDLSTGDIEAITEYFRPLGLPRRARLIHQLAKRILHDHGGEFPESEKDLRDLPGIGPYGAGAIASQVFGKRAPMIDINVKRIYHRIFSLPFKPRSAPTKRLRDFVLSTTPEGEEAAFNLALLDFGALVCTARDPNCPVCPMQEICDYYGRL